MALDLGELSIALELENDQFRRGLVEAKQEVSTLPPHVQREMSKVVSEMERAGTSGGAALANGLTRDASGRLRNARGQFASDAEIALAGLDPVAEKKGKDAGGKLAQGINQSLIRNSPLIVAGIAGALTAGAPVVLAASTAMFAGVGIAAASQNDEVRAAFAGLRDLVKDNVAAIGQPLADILPDIADEIGESFLRMQPTVIGAMQAIAPQVQTLTGSLLGMAENALPGIARAATNAGPAVEGLGRFLETVGTGIGDFFADLSTHAPAAGAAFDALGQIVAELLPIVSEFLGTGVELASVVLPPLADVLGIVGDALGVIAPVLPAVVAGFTAMKVVNGITGGMESVATRLLKIGENGGLAAGAATRAGNAIGGFAGAATSGVGPMLALSAGLAAVSANFMKADADAQAYARAMMQGGAAAAQAQQQVGASIAGMDASWVDGADSIVQYGDKLGWLGATFETGWDLVTTTTEEAAYKAGKALDEMTAGLSPLETAQSKVAEWTETLSYRMSKYGADSELTVIAQRKLAEWTNQLAAEQAKAELALHGVTQAMIDQANQALAAIDSSFGYRNAVNQLEDAQHDLATAIAEHGTGSEEAARAQLALEEQAYRTALAFGQQQADMSGAAQDSAEYARIVQETALQELYRLRDAAGPELAGALNQQIAMLEASGVTLGNTGVQARAAADRMRDLGISVQNVPTSKGVVINAPTEDQRRRIEALGYQIVTLPDGSVYVTADTAAARAEIGRLTAMRWTTTVYAQVAASSALLNLGRATGGPIYNYDSGGPITGPGTGTSDSIVATGPRGLPNYRLSNGEHIITAAEVRAAGGHGAVMAQRQEWLQRRADGGRVSDARGEVAVLDRPMAGRDAPLVQMNGVTIADQGDAEHLAQRLNYLSRLRG